MLIVSQAVHSSFCRSMKSRPLTSYFVLLIAFSLAVVLVIYFLGQKGLYVAQLYMLTPALSAVITRLFFYEKKFSDAFLNIGRGRHWLQFWLISALLAAISYLFYTLL